MRRTWTILTALCLVLASAAFYSGCACLHFLVGSGNTLDHSYTLTDFTRVSAGWTFNVEITQSAGFSLEVSADDNLTDYLDVRKDGDTLYLSLKSGYGYANTHLKAVVGMPRLTSLTLSGASNGSATGFGTADDFTLNVSGASKATFSGMVVNRLTMDISGASRASGDVINASGNSSLQASGASHIDLSGSGVDADIESSGASSVDLTDFSIRDAHVNVSGASNATVNASGTISGDVSGASHLFYTGTPTLGDLDASGASSISRK